MATPYPTDNLFAVFNDPSCVPSREGRVYFQPKRRTKSRNGFVRRLRMGCSLRTDEVNNVEDAMRICDHRRNAVDRRKGFTGRSCFKRTGSKGSSFAAYVRKMNKVNANTAAVKQLESALAETA